MELRRQKKRLESALIPGYSAGLQIDGAQSFTVSGEGFKTFLLVPVLFDSTNEDNLNPAPRCGVFFIPTAGSANFVPTVGYGPWEVETCEGLDGVGFVSGPQGRPIVLLLYTGASPNSIAHEPIILDWDPERKKIRGG
jgi:hypothetical protein